MKKSPVIRGRFGGSYWICGSSIMKLDSPTLPLVAGKMGIRTPSPCPKSIVMSFESPGTTATPFILTAKAASLRTVSVPVCAPVISEPSFFPDAIGTQIRQRLVI
nr:hypothetical protein [Escherichia coli]